MNRRAVLVSYLIVGVSATYMLIPSLLSLSNYWNYGGVLSSFFPAGLFAVAGLILGPYFGLAGIITKNKSVWVEVNRMLHTHISVPIVGGIALFYGSFLGYAFVFFLLPVYAIFVFLATLITVMAARTSKDPVTPVPARVAIPT